MPFTLGVVTDTLVPSSQLRRFFESYFFHGARVVDIHLSYLPKKKRGGDIPATRFVVVGEEMAMQKILLGVLGAMEWVTSAGSLGTPAQVYTRTPRGPSEVIQLHLVEGSVPKKKWDSVAACKIIMQAAVPKIIAFAKKHQFDEPKEYKYVAAPNALQIDVGDRNLAAALCSIDSPAFDKTFLLVPGLQLYASSVQVGRIPVYSPCVYVPPSALQSNVTGGTKCLSFRHDPYSFGTLSGCRFAADTDAASRSLALQTNDADHSAGNECRPTCDACVAACRFPLVFDRVCSHPRCAPACAIEADNLPRAATESPGGRRVSSKWAVEANNLPQAAADSLRGSLEREAEVDNVSQATDSLRISSEREVEVDNLSQAATESPRVLSEWEVEANNLPRAATESPRVLPEREVEVDNLPQAATESPRVPSGWEVEANNLPRAATESPRVLPEREVEVDNLPQAATRVLSEWEVEAATESPEESLEGAEYNCFGIELCPLVTIVFFLCQF